MPNRYTTQVAGDIEKFQGNGTRETAGPREVDPLSIIANLQVDDAGETRDPTTPFSIRGRDGMGAVHA